MKMDAALEAKIRAMTREKLKGKHCEHDETKVCDKCFEQAMEGAKKQLATMSKRDGLKIAARILGGSD